jgi:hypothetical protein
MGHTWQSKNSCCMTRHQMMLSELVKEEQAAIDAFTSFLQKDHFEVPDNEVNDGGTCDNSGIIEILHELRDKSGEALQQCQMIETLDEQLRLLSTTKETVKRLHRQQQLNHRVLQIISSAQPRDHLGELVSLFQSWREVCSGGEDVDGCEEVREFFQGGQLGDLIDMEIEGVLGRWSDDSEARDSQTLKRIGSLLDLSSSQNPLHGLFAAFPLSNLLPLLDFHVQLGHRQRLCKLYPDRLLNRFYSILGSRRQDREAFTAGFVEEIVPESMKFVARISCILEATFYFIKIHESFNTTNTTDTIDTKVTDSTSRTVDTKVDDSTSNSIHTASSSHTIDTNHTANFILVMRDKCAQILKQIRKSAQSERAYYTQSTSDPSVIDTQLNEIGLIHAQIRAFMHESLQGELDKWTGLYWKMEEKYLVAGIQRAIQLDQVVASVDEGTDFPVSSCIDDIFYVLQASQTRIKNMDSAGIKRSLISSTFKEAFLQVLATHLKTVLTSLKPMNLSSISTSQQPFKPSRDLITTVLLINNICAARLNWKSFSCTETGREAVNQDLDALIEDSITKGLYQKVLEPSVKKILNDTDSLLDLFSKINSLLRLIFSLFHVTLVCLFALNFF